MSKETRRCIEKYSTKFLGFKGLGVAFVFFVSLVWSGILLFSAIFRSGDVTDITLPVILLLVSGALLGGISEMEDSWKQTLEKYYSLPEEERNYDLSDYKEGYLYTDFKFDYYLYLFIKIVSLLTTIVVVGFALVMGYSRIQDVSPTSIIIFLLLTILFILITRKND